MLVLRLYMSSCKTQYALGVGIAVQREFSETFTSMSLKYMDDEDGLIFMLNPKHQQQLTIEEIRVYLEFIESKCRALVEKEYPTAEIKILI